jgi:hypothetical protein
VQDLAYDISRPLVDLRRRRHKDIFGTMAEVDLTDTSLRTRGAAICMFGLRDIPHSSVTSSELESAAETQDPPCPTA